MVLGSQVGLHAGIINKGSGIGIHHHTVYFREEEVDGGEGGREEEDRGGQSRGEEVDRGREEEDRGSQEEGDREEARCPEIGGQEARDPAEDQDDEEVEAPGPSARTKGAAGVSRRRPPLSSQCWRPCS